jgi:putative transposase
MGSATPLRADYVGEDLRKAARASRDADQTRRLLALAEIYGGATRGDAATVGGVTVQIVRDWVVRFNARGPAGLLNVKSPGKRPKLDDNKRQALRLLVEKGPIPAVHGVVRWRLKDLARWIFQEYRISLDESTVGRELKAMGFAKLSARPRHYAQNELAVEDFKKVSQTQSKRSARRLPPALK